MKDIRDDFFPTVQETVDLVGLIEKRRHKMGQAKSRTFQIDYQKILRIWLKEKQVIWLILVQWNKR